MKSISSRHAGTRALIAALVSSTIGACSSEPTHGEAPQDTPRGPLPACSWPAELDDADAAAGSCHAARTILSCNAIDGSAEQCMSDSAARCPDADVNPQYSHCVIQCHADEYAVSCGHVGPGQAAEPPTNCRTLPPNPGGPTFACCTCEP